MAFGDLLDACRVPGIEAPLVWVDTERLLAAGVDPWMGVPLWIGAPGWEAANLVDISRATDAGLAHRPVRDTLAGAIAFPGDGGQVPLTPEQERRLLERFATRSADISPLD